MALTQPLRVGDRVRMLRTAHGLSKGMQGRVVRVLPQTNCYDVRFEHYPWPRLVYGGDLALVERETAVGQP